MRMDLGYELLTIDECLAAGYHPREVHDGHVRSFWCLGFSIPYWSEDYESVLDEVKALKAQKKMLDPRP
jgi:hypothetical protein